ncbi:hypothetical protein BB561_005894 [Smittium simulii]|uniref:RNB domain-containing protein n=1 Tax=Smittium simulii TaxID=133385 RepID=A0A2T9Y7R1_9FUNG|nr:hypothetical protein BB561_005894 [Smittium simulii]
MLFLRAKKVYNLSYSTKNVSYIHTNTPSRYPYAQSLERLSPKSSALIPSNSPIPPFFLSAPQNCALNSFCLNSHSISSFSTLPSSKHNAFQAKADKKTLEAFKTLIDNLSVSLKNSQTKLAYSDVLEKNSILLDSDKNTSTDNGFQNNQLVIKRRPWKNRYPKPQKYYEPGSLVGVEWNQIEDSFTAKDYDPLEVLSDENSADSNQIQNENFSFSQKQMDYFKAKDSIYSSDPIELLDSILSEINISPTETPLNHIQNLKDEDTAFSQKIGNLVKRNSINSANLTKTATVSEIPIDISNSSSKYQSSLASQKKESSSTNKVFKPLDGSHFNNSQKRSFSTIKKKDSEATFNNSAFKSKFVKPKSNNYSKNPKNKSKASNINKNNYFFNTINSNPASTEYLSDNSKILHIGQNKIFIYDNQFKLANDKNRPLPLIGDMLEYSRLSNIKNFSEVSIFSTFAVVTSSSNGNAVISAITNDVEESEISVKLLNMVIPNYLFYNSTLNKINMLPSELSIIKKYIKKISTKRNKVNDTEDLHLSDSIVEVIKRHGPGINDGLKSFITKILSYSELDPTELWKKLYEQNRKTISIDEVAYIIINSNPKTKSLFASNKHGNYSSIVGKDLIDAKSKFESTDCPLMEIESLYWDIAKLAASELFGLNSHMFYPEPSNSVYSLNFKVLEKSQVDEYNHVLNLIKSNPEVVDGFKNNAMLTISNRFAQNLPSLFHTLSPEKEIEFRKKVHSFAKSLNNQKIAVNNKFHSKDDLMIISILKKYVINCNTSYRKYVNCYYNLVLAILKPLKLFDVIGPNSVYFFLVYIGAWPHYTSINIFDRLSNVAQFKLNPDLDSLYDECIKLTNNFKPAVTTATEFGKQENLHLLENKSSENNIVPVNQLSDTEFYKHDICESIRYDFGNLPVYTIDSESTSDIDDAISLEKIKNNNGDYDYWLHIHIADPTRLLHPNHKISKLSELRMSSLYYPGLNIHMLPTPWAIEQFSLYDKINDIKKKPDEIKKYAMTTSARIGDNGDILEYKIRPSIIRNIKCLSYDIADEIISFNSTSDNNIRDHEILKNVIVSPLYKDSGCINQNKNINNAGLENKSQKISKDDVDILLKIHEISKLHFKLRVKNGGFVINRRSYIAEIGNLYTSDKEIDFSYINDSVDANTQDKQNDLIYPKIYFKKEISFYSPSTKMISELMIISGRVAARFAAENNIPVIYRTQDKPNMEDYNSETFLMKSNIPEFANYSVEELNKNVKPKDIYEAVLKRINPVSSELSMLYYDEIRYYLKPGNSKSKPGIHSSTGIIDKFGYTRFTSPMRRYPDLLIHWQIKHQLLVLNGLAKKEDIPFTLESVESMLNKTTISQISIRSSMRKASFIWSTKVLQRVEYVARRTTDVNEPLNISKISLLPNYQDSDIKDKQNIKTKDLYVASMDKLTDIRFIPANQVKFATIPKSCEGKDETRIPNNPVIYDMAENEFSTTEVYENKNSMVPVWKVTVITRKPDVLHIPVQIKALGIEAIMIPSPSDPNLLPSAGDELEAVVVNISDVGSQIILRRVYK